MHFPTTKKVSGREIGGGAHRWRSPSVEEPIQGDRKGRPYYIRLPFHGCEVRAGAVPWYSRGDPRGRPGNCSRSPWKLLDPDFLVYPGWQAAPEIECHGAGMPEAWWRCY